MIVWCYNFRLSTVKSGRFHTVGWVKFPGTVVPQRGGLAQRSTRQVSFHDKHGTSFAWLLDLLGYYFRSRCVLRRRLRNASSCPMVKRSLNATENYTNEYGTKGDWIPLLTLITYDCFSLAFNALTNSSQIPAITLNIKSEPISPAHCEMAGPGGQLRPSPSPGKHFKFFPRPVTHDQLDSFLNPPQIFRFMFQGIHHRPATTPRAIRHRTRATARIRRRTTATTSSRRTNAPGTTPVGADEGKKPSALFMIRSFFFLLHDSDSTWPPWLYMASMALHGLHGSTWLCPVPDTTLCPVSKATKNTGLCKRLFLKVLLHRSVPLPSPPPPREEKDFSFFSCLLTNQSFFLLDPSCWLFVWPSTSPERRVVSSETTVRTLADVERFIFILFQLERLLLHVLFFPNVNICWYV